MSEFGTINLEELALEDQRLNADSNGGKRDNIFVSIPKPAKQGGTSTFPVRILPPLMGKRLFQYTRLHMIKGHSVHCPKDLVIGKNGTPVWDRNAPCPICDYYNGLWRKADKLEDQGRKAEAEKVKNEARSIKPIERYYYNAIVRQEKDENGEMQKNVGPKILSIGKILHKMILRGLRGDKETKEKPVGGVEGRAIDIKNGHDFIIRMELRGEEQFPNYDRTTFDTDSSPAGKPEEVKAWVEALHDLEALRKPATVEQLENELARHRGLIDDDDNSFDVDAFDAKFRKTPTVSNNEVATTSTSQNVSDDSDVEDTVVPTVEDSVVDDEDFMKEISDIMGD